MIKQGSTPKLIDLFCGCGGMSLGAARAGFNVVSGVDKDSRALKAHSLNFPNAKHLNFDIGQTSGSELLEKSGVARGALDVLAGGPPCQGFSTMGKRDVDDARNSLIFDFFRLVKEIKPKAFVLENVPGILHEKYAAILEAALEIVRKEYNVLKPEPIRACDVGAPTLRKRVFIVGCLKSLGELSANFWTPYDKPDVTPVVRHALAGLPFDINPDWKSCAGGIRTVKVGRKGFFFDSATSRIPVGVGHEASIRTYQETYSVTGCWGTKHSEDLEGRYATLAAGKSDSKTKSTRLDPNGYCPTLRAGTGPDRGSFQAVRPIHYLRPRVITPREAARLQGFPDWFQFDETKWHSFRQIGNSVSPLVSEYVMQRVIGALKNVDRSSSSAT